MGGRVTREDALHGAGEVRRPVLGWLFGVNANAVRITDDRYARHLLEAASDLEAS